MTIAAGTFPYKAPPLNANNTIGFLKELVTCVLNLFNGKIQCTGQFNLTASVTTSTITEPRCTQQSVILLSPLTANASSVYTSTYVSAYSEGSFVVTHTSLSSTDRTFRYACIG